MSFEIPRSAYRGLACFKCAEASKSLLKCSRCRRVSYCDESCQASDYRVHKRFCRAWMSLKKIEPAVLKTDDHDREVFEAFVEKRINWTLRELEYLLRGPLDKICQRLVIFEPRCAVCFRTDHDLERNPDYQGQRLSCCQECFSLYACSEDHGEMVLSSHSVEPYDRGGRLTRCKMHLLVVIDDEDETWCCRNLSKPVWFPERRLTKNTPLTLFPMMEAWTRWFSLPETQWPCDTLSLVKMRIASAPLSYPMTVRYGMELFDDSKCRALLEMCPGTSAFSSTHDPLHMRSHLEVHVVGLRANEIVAKQAMVFEELHHLLPECKQLTLRFIGPDLETYPSLYSEVPLDFDNMSYSCGECRQNGSIRIQSMHSAAYDDWVQDRRYSDGAGAAWVIPDFVVCFNASITEGPENRARWSPIISLLLDMGVPTLVSGFTEMDVEYDRDLVNDIGGLIVSEPHRNPWRNEQALPEFCGNDEFYFFNNHVFAFCGRAMTEFFS